MATPDAEPSGGVAQARIDLRQLLGILAGGAALVAASARRGDDVILNAAAALWLTTALAIGLGAGVWAVTHRKPAPWTCVMLALVVGNGIALGLRWRPDGWMAFAWAALVAAVSCFVAHRLWRVTAWDCFCMVGPTVIAFVLAGACLLALGMPLIRCLAS